MLNKKSLAFLGGTLVLILAVFWSFTTTKKNTSRVLLFSKTEGYRHSEAIVVAQDLFQKMAKEHGFIADTTENSEDLNENNLQRYQAIVFLHVSGSVLDSEQRTSLQRYIQAGGGFLGIHASADAERDWPWYGKLHGAYFNSHPKIQQATYRTIDKGHPASSFLPDSIVRTDEFYNFKQVSPEIHVLMTIDESSYVGGNMGKNHPAVWYQEFDGGRSFYTSMGHTIETYSEPFFVKQLWEGLNWVMGGTDRKALDYSDVIPEENRFIENVLMTGLDEPMQLAVANDERVFFAQRRGEIIEYDQKKRKAKSLGIIPVSSKYEDGLLGFALDPKFSKNQWIYAYYTAPSGQAFNVSRFTLNSQGLIDFKSEKVVIAISKDVLDGSHTGGFLLFDPRGTGNLFIAVGDNSSPRKWPWTPIDERPGRELWNAQRSSSNTNDLRGKILRIHPEANGTYTIPEGNLFPGGTLKTRPEIYSMGHRQPWGISMDTKSGWLFAGEVGPDSRKDSIGLGPQALDEFNIIKKPGNFGWPYFVGPNRAYWKYDFVTGKSGDQFDPVKPINDSRLNTGLMQLPPAQPAVIWYPYSISKEFPLMGTGGRTAVSGPIFRKADFKNAQNTFPKYYEGKWFITEWIRDWIFVVTLDENGNYKSMERFMPNAKFAGPMNMTFGPDGSMYLLEYGKGWFTANDDSKLVRIDYNGGNRKPVVEIQATKTAGVLPFKVDLSSKGTKDYDKDALKFDWKISPKAGGLTQSFTSQNPSVILMKAGVYNVILTVTDDKGAKSSAQIDVVAGGNAPPKIELDIVKGNRTFFFPGSTISYEVKIEDKEDGNLTNGNILANEVNIHFNFAPGGYKPVLGDPTSATSLSPSGGMALNANNCYSCHSIDKKSVGPTFNQISERYKGDATAPDRLIDKILSGGFGNWGQVAMNAHPDLPRTTAKSLVDFILGLSVPAPKSFPVKGIFNVGVAPTDSKDVYVLKASYTDKGAKDAPPVTSEDVIILRNPEIHLAEMLTRKGSMNIKNPVTGGVVEFLPKSGDYLVLRQIDLTDISGIEISGGGSGTLELRLDSPTGNLIGKVESSPKSQSGIKANNQPEKIHFSEVSGIHDLYFLLKGKSFTIYDKIKFLPQ